VAGWYRCQIDEIIVILLVVTRRFCGAYFCFKFFDFLCRRYDCDSQVIFRTHYAVLPHTCQVTFGIKLYPAKGERRLKGG